MMNNLLHRKRWTPRWVMLWFCILCIVRSYAWTDWSNSWNSFTWNAEKGVIECGVRYYQTFGGSGDGHCGFTGGVTVMVGPYRIYIDASEDASDRLERVEYAEGVFETGRSRSDPEVLYFSVPVAQEYLNSTVNISINGTWWRRGGLAKDQSISHSLEVTTSWARSPFENRGFAFTERNGEPAIKLDWRRNNGSENANSWGNVRLANVQKNFLNQSRNDVVDAGSEHFNGTFWLDPEGNNYNPNATAGYTYHIVQRYNPTENSSVLYETVTDEGNKFIIPAYTQVGEDFKATFDATNRKILVTWTMPATPSAPGEYVSDNFRLNYKFTAKPGSLEASYEAHQLIPYVAGQKSYQVEIPVQEGTDGEYSFEIYRTYTDPDDSQPSVWRTKYARKTELKDINSYHVRASNLQAAFTQDESAIKVTWDITGAVWSDGTKVTLSRMNVTYGSSDDIVLSKSDFEKGSYEDRVIRMCNEYQYKMLLQPNDNYGSINPIYTDPNNTLIMSEKGNLLDFTASKGYFSNRVELSWTKTGIFDEFAIERKEYGQDDSMFKKILTEPSSTTSDDYIIKDETAEPGKIYTYRIVGFVQCADSVLRSDEVLSDIGFRTPTGDIYGRVTYENGQAEDSVEVYLESDIVSVGKSLQFNGETTKAYVEDASLLGTCGDIATIQAWVKLDNSGGAGKRSIISKKDMYEIGLTANNKIYFKVGDGANEVVSEQVFGEGESYFHVTAVKEADSISLYINGLLEAKRGYNAGTVMTGTGNQLVLGGSTFIGWIDEVRIWGRALAAHEIATDYNRYIVGNEDKLIAYYTFDYSVESAFYDMSYDKMSVYNEHHGKIENAVLSETIPTNAQLGYRAYTGKDGSYTIRAIPYIGNGTSYNIIPKRGIHEFEPQQEIRLISAGSQNFTVNFTDVSSFDLPIRVVYEGGTYPVQGVQFKIDGITAVNDKNVIYQTDAAGEVTIRVPVGTHEVKAVMDGHTFAIDGRICNSDSSDINYQDNMERRTIEDITLVKYIGRVAGGTIQESYPLGFGLSKNNLADNIRVTLKHQRSGYEMYSTERSETFTHELAGRHISGVENVGSIKMNPEVVKDNTVTYNQEGAVISVNNETGEFVAWLRPEKYTLSVNATGHTTIPGNNSELNLTSVFTDKHEKYEHKDSVWLVTDSVMSMGDSVCVNVIDSVAYNMQQKFIVRVSPEVSIVQQDAGGNLVSYYGAKVLEQTDLAGNRDSIVLVNDNNTYLFGKPVFVQADSYTFDISIFEGYRYNGGTDRVDRVPTKDASIQFNNQISHIQDTTITADSLGHAVYSFFVGDPNINTGIQQVSANVTIGAGSNSPITFAWVLPANFVNGEAYVIGGRQTGVNFVTGGPDKVLTILRDPPGSNSYAYLEKGMTFKETSTYTGGVSNEGKETWGQGIENSTSTLAGAPGAGTVTSTTSTSAESALGVVHAESYAGSDSKSTSTTLTTRFATSSSPEYVGADADLYVGYATNMTFGKTNNVSIISRSKFDNTGADYYEDIFVETPDWVLVQNDGTNISQKFRTLFAYPQRHIIDVLIPNLRTLRNQYLMPYETYKDSIQRLQQLAIEKDTVFYLSYFSADSPDYGKSNSDTTITDRTHGDVLDPTNGPSYMIIYDTVPATNGNGVLVPICDTISYMNQAIAAWEQQIANNEKAKLEATLLQNYSFHAGSEIEYSESYSFNYTSTNRFEVLVGAIFTAKSGSTLLGVKARCDFEELANTTHGGEFSSESERNHTKGFVLSEDGTDYLTVDVMREKDERYGVGSSDGDIIILDSTLIIEPYYPGFIFRTKGGSTSCPYEGERVTQYYQPGTQLDAPTMVIEKPAITADVYTMENVPSGEAARFTIYMSNESEVDESVWYNLKVVDSSNPNGAKITMDGSAIGSGRRLIVPSGDVLTKTIEITKGAVLDYDNLQLVLESECQPSDETDVFDDIADTLTLSVHFTKSCTEVEIIQPATNWTYNTKLDTMTKDNLCQHYMPIVLGEFDVNYPEFDHIELQYKPSSGSDNDYITLCSFYNDSTLYEQALDNGMTAAMINSSDGGKIHYNWFMDNLMDQRYDLRAVAVCNIANELIYTYSEISSGIKDQYNPRLFGSPQPADGILGVEDEIRLNFNEPIADGYITKNNFQVTAVLNGTETDHSVSVFMDGIDDYMASDAVRNLTNKDFTVEMWINGNAQDAVLFSHGNVNDNINFGITVDNYLFVKMNGKEIRSVRPFNFDQGSWAHIAMVFKAEGEISLYYNFDEILSNEYVGPYNGIGNFVIGRDIDGQNQFTGKLHNLRVWDKVRTMGELQLNSNIKMSGNDVGLMLYCPMDEAKGTVLEDKARGANLAMYGCEWVTPEGRSTLFDGSTAYLTANTSAAVIQSDMDFTIEFWFKAAEGSQSVTMLSNGRGDGNDLGGSLNTFTIGFDENGHLYFMNNANKVIIEGEFADENWHHIAVTAGRVQGRVQIYMDGKLTTYFGINKTGGIEGASLYIGARGWYNPGDALTLHVGEYFKGSIDEVRLWNLYKTAALVEEYMYKRLDGDELGLIAYYPFEYYREWQGAQELNYTLQDQKKPADPSQSAPVAVVTGTAVESADIAPIVDKGPETNLEFNYVVNNDALIINLDVPQENVEKTIVTFTVDGILDVNGNEILSPITWSAYIDRNQLKWSQNEWTDSKQLYEAYEFTVDIINNGGSIINYTIENMPSWLSAEPSEGKMDPSSVQHVTFTVREDLNVGTYNEVIYLKNEDNVNEPLELNLTVVGKIPDWKVDPSDYEYSMSIFGKMRFNNIFSDDKNDIIAAFNGNECVGVAYSEYNKDLDMWYAMLTVYNKAVIGGSLTFRMWDASTGITYMAVPNQEITFKNNSIYGTPMEPVIFDGMTIIYQDILLNEGWNWISLNLQNEKLADVNGALASGSWSNGDIIKTIMLVDDNLVPKFADYSATNKSWNNTAGFSLNNTSMYLLRSAKTQVLSVDGVLVAPETVDITLKAGVWNYIGYLPNSNLPLKTALAGYEAKEGDVIKSLDKFAMYSGNNWFGSLEYMEPNKGYMLLNNDATDKTLVYPSTATTFSSMPSRQKSSPYSLNMNVIAVGDMISDGDIVYAMVSNEVRGESVPVALSPDKTLQFISVAGEVDMENITFRLQKADGTEYYSVNTILYRSNTVIGSIENPYVISFDKGEHNGGNSIAVTPNPATDMINVMVQTTAMADVTIRLMDVNGRVLYATETETVDAGTYTRNLVISHLPSGSYLVQATIGGETYEEKVIKK